MFSPDLGGSLCLAPRRSPALRVLVALAVASPWPFGSVHPRATQAIALVALAASLAALPWPLITRRRAHEDAVTFDRPATMALVLALGLWLLGAAQLIPLPRGLHAMLAPGTAAVWDPAEPAAAAVLGPGPHPVSVFPAATARWLAFLGAMVGLGTVASPALRERRTMLHTAVTVVAGAVVLALYAFAARLWFGDRLFGAFNSPITPFGPFVNKNHFAGYVEMTALLAVGLATGLGSENRIDEGLLGWVESPRASRVVLAWASAVVLVLAVPVSLSRGGVVSLVAGLVAFVVLRIGTRRAAEPPRGGSAHAAGPSGFQRARLVRSPLFSIAAALAAVAVILPAVHFVLPERARARIATIGQGGGDSSSAYRLGLWRDTLCLAASSPLVGSGFGAFADAIPRFKTNAGNVRVEHAENDWLELLAEGGLAGALLGDGAIAMLFVAGWHGLRNDPHRLSRGIRTGALAGLVALSGHGFFDFNLHISSNALLGALLAAVVCAPVSVRVDGRSGEGHEMQSEVKSASMAEVAWRRVIASALLLTTAVTVASFALTLACDWTVPHGASAGLSAGVGSLRRATTDADIISQLRRRPADAERWIALAWLRLNEAPRDVPALTALAIRLDPANERLIIAADRLVGPSTGRR